MNVSIKKISIILFGLLLITGCGENEGVQSGLESSMVNIHNRSMNGTRDAEDAKNEAATLIAENQNKEVTGWVCKQLNSITDDVVCNGKTSMFVNYTLKVTNDLTGKRFYRDTLTFSGRIEKITIGEMGSVEVILNNVTLEKAEK